MTVLKLVAEPTFKSKVKIPIPGAEPAEVVMEFKHRTKDELEKFTEAAKERGDVQSVLDTVVGWELTDKFNEANVKRLLQNYHGAGRAIAATYYTELMALRQGN